MKDKVKGISATRKSKRIVAALASVVVAASAVIAPSLSGNNEIKSNAADTGLVKYSAAANSGLKNVMYYGDWAIWAGQGNFYPSALSADVLTHLNFAFIDFDIDGNVFFCDPSSANGAPMDTLTSSDGWIDGRIPYSATNAGILPAFNDIRAAYPNLRFGFSVGGWSKCLEFTPVARDDAKRAKLVENLIGLMRGYGANFIDIDWEYPGSRREADLKDNRNDEGTPYANAKDGVYFVDLLKDIKAAQNKLSLETGEVYELSAALPSTSTGFMKGAQGFLPDEVLKTAYANPDALPNPTVKYGSQQGSTQIESMTLDLTDDPTDPTKITATKEQWSEAAEQYVHGIFDTLDYGNLMTYDMRGAFDNTSGHQSPLYPHPLSDYDDCEIQNIGGKDINEAAEKNFSSDELVQFLLASDRDSVGNLLKYTTKTAVNSKKILLGVCIYTRGWHDVNSKSTYKNAKYPGLFQLAAATNPESPGEVGAKPATPPTNGDGGWATGVYGYRQITEQSGAGGEKGELTNRVLKKEYPDVEFYWDDVAQAGYLYGKTSGAFFTYDEEKAIAAKAAYIKKFNLGGMISWQASNDSKGSTGKYDFVTRTIKDELWGKSTNLQGFIAPTPDFSSVDVQITYPYGENYPPALSITATTRNVTAPVIEHYFPQAGTPYMNSNALWFAQRYGSTIFNPTYTITFKGTAPAFQAPQGGTISTSGNVTTITIKDQWAGYIPNGQGSTALETQHAFSLSAYDAKLSLDDIESIYVSQVLYYNKGNKGQNFLLYSNDTAPKKIPIEAAEINGIEPNYYYGTDPKSVQPVPTSVIVDGKELKEGTDYTAKYEFTIGGTTSDDSKAGAGYLILTGIGNYTGEKVVSYSLNAYEDALDDGGVPGDKPVTTATTKKPTTTTTTNEPSSTDVSDTATSGDDTGETTTVSSRTNNTSRTNASSDTANTTGSVTTGNSRTTNNSRTTASGTTTATDEPSSTTTSKTTATTGRGSSATTTAKPTAATTKEPSQGDFYYYGDANLDRQVDILDVVIIQAIIVTPGS
ncbi:MAG: hypothetical protein LBN42_02860, partial [Oscillospiraceae bacterium]|nr:hypothetical protein [Oscillospiraceae bacterium]